MAEEQGERTPRRRRTRSEANEVAAACEASGLTREEFSRRQDIPVQTLARYVARYRREKAAGSSPNVAPRWVAVELAEPRGRGDELAVLLSRGRRIEIRRGFDGETLRRLVVELERV